MAGTPKKKPHQLVRRGGTWPEGPFAGYEGDIVLLHSLEMVADIARDVEFERRKRKWSRRTLGDEANVTPQTIYRLEKGHAWVDSLSMARLLAALDLKLAVAPREYQREISRD